MPEKHSSSEQLVNIADIRQGTIVLRNKSLRAVLMVSSLNFALKSSDEQKSIIFAYQEFLNSLDFPIQVVVQSRQINIDNYLQKVQNKGAEQNNELLQMQINEYCNFIDSLIEEGQVMQKSFFLIIPFSPIESRTESVFDKAKNLIKDLKPSSPKQFTETNFQEYKEQLWQRVDYIISGLSGLGLNVKALDTEDLLELFYNLYN